MTPARRLLFLGDSLIEYYDWQSRFPDHEVINLGVAGETAPELLTRVAAFTGTTYQADGVVLMTGTNDLLQGVAFLTSYQEIVQTLKALWPAAHLLVNGLLPMALPWLPPNLIRQTNARLEELALRYKIGYLDGCRLFSGQAASTPCFLDDGVHLSPLGYTVWSAAIENHLRLTGCI